MTDPTLPPPPGPTPPPYGQTPYGQTPSGQAPFGQPQPAPPIPPKRGMPAWGWVLIAVGAAMLIGLIVVVIAIVVAVTSLRPTPVDPIVLPTSPVETVEPTDDPVLTDGSYGLDTLAPAAMGPFWSVPGDMLTEWETVVFDVDGLNHFQNAELGCDFRTYQASGVGDSGASSDRVASDAQMDVLADVWIDDGVTVSSRVAQPTVWLEYDLSNEVEFLVDRVDGTYADTGIATTTYLFSREFLSSGGALAARLECRTDTIDGPNSPLSWILEDLGAVTF